MKTCRHRPRGARAAILALAIAAATFSPHRSHAGESVEAALDAAEAAASSHDYAAVLKALRTAAAAGDRGAQRSAGLMLLYGESLYGAAVPSDRAEAIRWLNAAAANGCEVSAWILRRLGTPAATAQPAATGTP